MRDTSLPYAGLNLLSSIGNISISTVSSWLLNYIPTLKGPSSSLPATKISPLPFKLTSLQAVSPIDNQSLLKLILGLRKRHYLSHHMAFLPFLLKKVTSKLSEKKECYRFDGLHKIHLKNGKVSLTFVSVTFHCNALQSTNQFDFL